MKFTKNLGMSLLGIWLIMNGLIPLLHLSFSGLSTLGQTPTCAKRTSVRRARLPIESGAHQRAHQRAHQSAHHGGDRAC